MIAPATALAIRKAWNASPTDLAVLANPPKVLEVEAAENAAKKYPMANSEITEPPTT